MCSRVENIVLRCDKCDGARTRHSVLKDVSRLLTADDDENAAWEIHQIIECKGCGARRFRQAETCMEARDSRTGVYAESREQVFPEVVPVLPSTRYDDIVRVIYETGKSLERHPSAFAGKQEEDLRDYFLTVLASHHHAASGETLNKSGKTDILIRYEGKNLFVAECGVWKGAKKFLGKIDQLLSYLTWRDSKTALVCFVKNKHLGDRLKTIQEQVPTHDCFVKCFDKKEEAWFRYEFHLPGDGSRTVKLAVLVFHFPPVGSS